MFVAKDMVQSLHDGERATRTERRQELKHIIETYIELPSPDYTILTVTLTQNYR